jgi:hypothetical protein
MAKEAVRSNGTDPPSDPPTNHAASNKPEADDGVKIKFDLVLRLEIKIKDDINIRVLVRSTIEALLKTEADTTVKSKDGNHSFQTMNDFPKNNDNFDLFFQKSKIKARQGPTVAVIEMHITSSQTLASLKRPSTFLFERLKKDGIWLKEHRYKTLRLEAVGFLADCSTEFTWKSSCENEIRSILEARIAEEHAAKATDNVIDMEQVEAPPDFELSPRTIRHSHKGKGGRIKFVTNAYEICCETIHKNRMIALLTSKSNKDLPGTFIPFSMAKSDPVAFGRLISKHERYLENLRMIAVYGLNRKVMESPTSDSDNPTFRGHLRDFQDCNKAADGSQTYTPMLLGIESTTKTDSHGKYMFLCTKESEHRVQKWIDTQLPIQYETATRSDPNYQSTDKVVFPAPSRGNFTKRAPLLDEYEANLRASISNMKPETDSQEDPALPGGYIRKRPTKTRKQKEIKLVYDSSDSLFPTLLTTGCKSFSAQAPDNKNTYSARTAASIPSAGSPPEKQATGTFHHSGGDSATNKNDVDDLRRQVEENDAKIAALVAAARNQDATIEKMQAMHNKTQATVDSLIDQISKLVALISSDPKPASEAENHALATISNNKRNSTGSPMSSPSETNRTSKRVDVTTSPMIKRLFGGFSYSASMSTDDIASNSQQYPD